MSTYYDPDSGELIDSCTDFYAQACGQLPEKPAKSWEKSSMAEKLRFVTIPTIWRRLPPAHRFRGWWDTTSFPISTEAFAWLQRIGISPLTGKPYKWRKLKPAGEMLLAELTAERLKGQTV